MDENQVPVEKEPLKNECAFNYKNITEGIKGSTNGFLRSTRLIELLLAVLIIACAIIWIEAPNKWVFTVCGAVLLLLVLYMQFIQPGQLAKRQLARIKESFHCDGYDTSVEFTPEAIISYNRTIGQDISVEYAAIDRVKETKNLILMITKKKSMFLLDKKRFVNGTELDFWHLIFDQCPTAKMQRKSSK